MNRSAAFWRLMGKPGTEACANTPAETHASKAPGPGGPHFVSVSEGPTVASVLEEKTASCATYVLAAQGLAKKYCKAAVEIPVLKGVDLAVHPGEILAVVGQSGSGKSTLLHLLGLLDQPDAGTIWLHGKRVDNVSGLARDRLRNRVFGMVFQFYHLLPELSTLENVMIPLMIGQGLWQFWRNRKAHRRHAVEILERVGLGHRLKHRPRELSGGELQRAAIARALVNRPQILLADEPTGNLDPATGKEILRLIQDLNRETGLTIVMVTHDHTVAELADRVVCLVDGRIKEPPR